MAVINDVGGTSLNSFSINGGVTFYQGDNLPNVKMGKEGDYYFKSDGYMYVKRNGIWLNLTSSAMPDARTIANKVIYSNGENFDASGITYNATDKSTFMDGALSIGKHPSATNSTSSKIVPTIGWINDPTLSTNVVHRSGDESINGDKTFYQSVRINCKDSNNKGLFATTLALESYDVKKGQVPPTISGRDDQTRYWTVCAVDKTLYNQGATLENIDTPKINHNKFGQFEIAYYTNKKVETRMEAFNPNVNDSRAVIAVGWDENGNKYSNININPANQSNDDSIATTKWANSNCVMTYGNQNIADQKTFTNREVIETFNSDGSGNGFAIIDNNNRGSVKMLEYVTANKTHWGRLLNHAYNKDCYIDLTITSAGNREISLIQTDKAVSLNPPDNSNDQSIATTYWVNTKIANNKAIKNSKFEYIPNTYIEYWGGHRKQCFRAYVEFSNGFKIQWGLLNAWGSRARVDLLTPFSNTNYSVTLSRYHEEWAEGVMMQSTDYNKGYFYVTLNDPGCYWHAIGN